MNATLHRREVSPAILVGVVRILDVVGLAFSSAVSLLAYPLSLGDNQSLYLSVILSISGIILFLNNSFGLYKFDRLRVNAAQLPMCLAICLISFLALILSAFVFKFSDHLSRGWVGTWFLTEVVFSIILRGTLARLMRRWVRDGRLTRKIVVIGAGPIGQRFIDHVHADPSLGVQVIGLFDDRHTRVPAVVGGVALTGGLTTFIEFCRNNAIQTVVIALPLAAEDRILQLIDIVRSLPVDIKLLPDLAGFRLLNKPMTYLAQIPMLSAHERPIKEWRAVAKSAEDLILASILAIIITPLLLFIALIIKLDSKGPVFFRQKRYGFNNKLIEVYKFRTMYHDKADAAASRLVTRNDDRVTRFGRFLRRSSFDELPQIYNVLLGTMSLVGPRPHATSAKAADTLYDEAVANYASRHRVKPGITGWAQVNGWRGETDTIDKLQSRVEHDLFYIDQWSPAFDFYILLLTITKGMVNKNAY